MNEEQRLYFAQQPHHWIGAEEEIVAREDMLQEPTMNSYEEQNQLVNNFWTTYAACEPNNNNPNYNLQSHEVFTRPQQDIAPKLNYYTNFKYEPGFERSTYQGKSPLLKKMLQAPTGVSLEEIARTDIYLPNWSHQYPQQDTFNDNNSDTLTAESEGEFDWETYRGYMMPNNVYYQNSINAQESCTTWINNLNNPMNDVKQAACYDNSNMVFYTNQALLEQERQTQSQAIENQMLSTNMQDNQYSFYYSQDLSQQNLDYYNQNGNADETFVMSEQDAPVNLNDCEQFEFKPFANDSITYTVLQDKNENVGESELISVPMQEQVNESTNDQMQPYWPRWRSNVNNKPLNLEILLNVRSKSNVSASRDDLGQVVFCCQTPVLSDKVNAQNSSTQFTNGLTIENRHHNFSTYPLVYHSIDSPDDGCAQVCKTMKVEDTMTDETGMDESLEQNDGFNYYFVQDYQECTLEAEAESGKMITDTLMSITN